MTADDWMRRAISDDALVAELLLRLKHSDETLAAADQLKVLPSPTPQMFLLPGWGKKKVRSAVAKQEKSEARRRSPNTPLSWNNGGGDGCGTSASDLNDETSRGSDGKSISRSKGALCVDTASISAMDQRYRKKRTFPELTEEISLQLKENADLKKESCYRIGIKSSLPPVYTFVQKTTGEQMTLKEKKAETERLLKRFKKTDNGWTLQSMDAHRLERGEEKKKTERKFVLPDLNLPPPIQEDEENGLDCNSIHRFS